MLTLVVSCSSPLESDLTLNSIIPKPRTVEATGEFFIFSNLTRVRVSEANDSLFQLANLLELQLKKVSFRNDSTKLPGFYRRMNRIELSLDRNMIQEKEGYVLEINPGSVNLAAPSPEGLFRGLQTLFQVIDVDGSHMKKMIALPTGLIRDFPEFSYRGVMLDVSRHFFDPGQVKKFIDQISLYKINHLHLGLSNDQGWRIEIKSWPKLTEIGGSTEVGGGEGGFYTQEQYAELVRYAAERFITIVPEIDMPGHTNAALASYAELNCDGKARELYTGTRVGFSTLCTDSEITYQFVDDVIRELSSLTPGPYIHIGGDESHVTPLNDYIYFINRVRKIVLSHGKLLIGWDEISNADISAGDIAQYWASGKNADMALSKGARLIISPAEYCYLDMKYDSSTSLGLNWAGYIETDKAYNWYPLELVEGITKEQVLGLESPLWGETIETNDDIEFLVFPRLTAHAEIGWSDRGSLSWEDYSRRLAAHGPMLEALGINYYRSPRVNW